MWKFTIVDTSYRNGFPQSGTFVSKLLDHGIAASTNLLHPNDEIIEVNGIDVGPFHIYLINCMITKLRKYKSFPCR